MPTVRTNNRESALWEQFLGAFRITSPVNVSMNPACLEWTYNGFVVTACYYQALKIRHDKRERIYHQAISFAAEHRKHHGLYLNNTVYLISV